MEQTRNFLPVVSTACSNCKHCRIVSVDARFCVFECKCVGTKNPVNGHVTYKDCKNARALINGDWNIDCMWYEQRLSALQKVKRFFKRLTKTTDPFLEEPASDDLEEEIDRFEEWLNNFNQSDYPTSYTIRDIARHFAKWQKEQMMKNAVDATVHNGLYNKYVKEQDSDTLNKALEKYNPGDKVKIIIVKEEQQ